MIRKEKERDSSIELRKKGIGIQKIAEIVGVNRSTVSNWVKFIQSEKVNKQSTKRTKEGLFFCNLPIEEIEQMIKNGMSFNDISKKFKVSPNLVSRSFRKRGIIKQLKTLKRKINDQYVCKYCQKKRTKSWTTGTTCPTCTSMIRRIKMKSMAVKELGGKCERCGWKPNERELSAIEFHHKDSEKKDFSIGSKVNHKWSTLLPEIKKCELLCSRCHRIEHSRKDPIFDFLFEKTF